MRAYSNKSNSPCTSNNSSTSGMTLLEVVVSFAIFAIVLVIFISGFAAVGNLNSRTDLQEKNDASLSLDIETAENLKETGSQVKERITSNDGYYMDISIITYTSIDGQDSIRAFNYEP